MKGIIALPFAAAVIVAAILVTSVVLLTGEDGVIQKEPPQLKKFASYQELADYIKASDQAGSGFGGYFGSNARGAIEPQAAGAAEDSGQQKSEDYSATNIQVAGVDEADIVKNDGKYIYTVSGNKVIIVDAYPAENAKILSEIDTGGPVQEIFVSGDRLVVFGHQQITYPSYKPNEGAADESGVSIPSRLIPYYYQPKMFLQVYDVSDRENPAISRNMTINGTYFDSRMIGDYAYVIVNMPVSLFGNGDIAIPLLQESGSVTPSKAFPDIYYFDNPDFSYRFTTILSLNTQSDSQGPESQIYLMGDAQNIFVSQQNIYITYSKNLPFYEVTDRLIDEVVLPLVPELGPKIQEIRGMDIPAYEKSQRIYEAVGKHMEGLSQEELRSLQDGAQARLEEFQARIAKEIQKTIIHKIEIDNGNVKYKVQGDVPGYVLNQFSMDEFEGYFRIATTTNEFFGFGDPRALPTIEPQAGVATTEEAQAATAGEKQAEPPQTLTVPPPTRRTGQLNHVYVLDGDLNVVGKLEDIAPDESIYSARFIGSRAYMVTFRQVDPLFVIDLSDPANPHVLGQLKIPGVSDYLHPYDENHIIGVGRDATEEGRIKGLKLSLFDVMNPENPREIDKYFIGERGTDSEALRDHKAFLFSREKGLLVIPVLLAEADYRYSFQGAYVFSIGLEDGFDLKGRITHVDGQKDDGYYYFGPNAITRSLYIGDTLYTISAKMIKMNDLGGLDEVNKIELPAQQADIPICLACQPIE